MFSGCVYDKPAQNEFSPQGVDELTAADLQSMKLEGLPIRAAHGKYQGKDIGRITDEWSGEDGSKYISFQIDDKPDLLGYKEVKILVVFHNAFFVFAQTCHLRAGNQTKMVHASFFVSFCHMRRILEMFCT
jgi:hypothetical protein